MRKTFEYQIRITDNKSGEMEVYAIDGVVYTSVVNGNVLINFTKANNEPGAFSVSPDTTIKIGFFEISH